MNHWQPMIDRCNEMDHKINDVLARRLSIATSNDGLSFYKIDDLETILFAVRYVANSLGSMKMGASQKQGIVHRDTIKTDADLTQAIRAAAEKISRSDPT